MPTKDHCSGCGKVVARTPKSLPSILCHDCRGLRPKPKQAWTPGYVAPSKLDRCTDCGTQVQRSWTSAERIVCRVCRRKARPPAPKPEPIPLEPKWCPTCGVEFEPRRTTQIYCAAACRPGRKIHATKPSASARGYGTEHRREREKWKSLVEAGGIDCARCGNGIHPDEPWDLDHTDDRSGYLGPSHRSCNRSDGGHKRHQPGAAPSATAHLKWEWRDCEDCGRRCYGKRCADCHRAARSAP